MPESKIFSIDVFPNLLVLQEIVIYAILLSIWIYSIYQFVRFFIFTRNTPEIDTQLLSVDCFVFLSKGLFWVVDPRAGRVLPAPNTRSGTRVKPIGAHQIWSGGEPALQLYLHGRSVWSDQGAAQEIQWWTPPHPCRPTAHGLLTWCDANAINFNRRGNLWNLSFGQTTFSQPASLDSPARGSSPASPCTRVTSSQAAQGQQDHKPRRCALARAQIYCPLTRYSYHSLGFLWESRHALLT